MLFHRTCPLTECGLEFDTDNPRKRFCSEEHSKVGRVREWRARHRKKGGGGGGGGGNGGGQTPTLFDTITPVNSDAAFVPLPVIGPGESERKPVTSAIEQSRKAAA